jgi:hypothetical protein
VQAERAREHAEGREQLTLRIGQEVMAPGERASQGAMAGRKVARAAGEEPQAVGQPCQHRVGGEDVDPRGGQLDGQRQPVQPVTDLLDRRAIALVQGEARQDG